MCACHQSGGTSNGLSACAACSYWAARRLDPDIAGQDRLPRRLDSAAARHYLSASDHTRLRGGLRLWQRRQRRCLALGGAGAALRPWLAWLRLLQQPPACPPLSLITKRLTDGLNGMAEHI